MRFAEQPRRTRNICVRLSDDELSLLEHVAQAQGVTVTQIVRAALASALEPQAGKRYRPGAETKDRIKHDNGRADTRPPVPIPMRSRGVQAKHSARYGR